MEIGVIDFVPPASEWKGDDRKMLNGCGPQFRWWKPWTWVPVPELVFGPD